VSTEPIPAVAVNDVGAVRLRLASPQDIRSWSSGQVTTPATINYLTYRPEKDGLFCERIFGPEKDWECACGKYRGMKYKDTVCDRCGVKVTHSRVRRSRLGHIELPAPMVHIWFFKSYPNRLGLLLDMTSVVLEKIIYYHSRVVLDPGPTPLKRGQVLTEEEYARARALHGDAFTADIGGAAIQKLLQGLDLSALAGDLRRQIEEKESRDRPPATTLRTLGRRLAVVQALLDSATRPEWMVLECLPVLPPDLRPLILLDSGDFATSDLNDLYRRVINRVNRLRKLVDLNAPEVILLNEKRMLQQTVDALFDNNRCKRPVLGSNNRPLKSLTDMIKGRQGRFQENLLGKRVDYSARAPLVPDPSLGLDQCALPFTIAAVLFQPLVLGRLVRHADAKTAGEAQLLASRLCPRPDLFSNALRADPERRYRELAASPAGPFADALAAVVRDRPVLLTNPVLPRQTCVLALEPVLTQDNALRAHPLVCRALAAGNGEAVAVHLPLSEEAQRDALLLLPGDNRTALAPSAAAVLGCRHLTAASGGDPGGTFSSPAEVVQAHEAGRLDPGTRLGLRLPAGRTVVTEEGRAVAGPEGGRVCTTAGRVLFNDLLPPALPFYDLHLDAGHLERILADCHRLLGRRRSAELLERIERLGCRHLTRLSLTPERADLEGGLTPQGLFAAASAHRRAVVSTALHSADSAYLMRKLVAAAGDVVVTLHDCSTPDGVLRPLVPDRLRGRVSRDALAELHTGRIVLRAGEVLTDETLAALAALYLEDIRVRSPLTCRALRGVCRLCYGADPATGALVEEGTPVGIRAALAAGAVEMPLNMRTSDESERTRRLRRLGELWEARTPRQPALLAEVDGTVRLVEHRARPRIVIENSATGPEGPIKFGEFEHRARAGVKVLVKPGDVVRCGDRLTEGTVAPQDLLRVLGVVAVGDHLVGELAATYRSVGLSLDDRDLEMVVAQMLHKVKVKRAGDTSLVAGALMDRAPYAEALERVRDRVCIDEPGDSDLQVGQLLRREEYEAQVQRFRAEGLEPPRGRKLVPPLCSVELLGLTAAASQPASFLAAATLQETTKVLTSAALAGRADPLTGLRENVLMGRLIPAGSGWLAHLPDEE
jgi:DNA-directed RNA polymerase beta' subunit